MKIPLLIIAVLAGTFWLFKPAAEMIQYREQRKDLPNIPPWKCLYGMSVAFAGLVATMFLSKLLE